MASEGQNHREIARNLDINRQTARLWRNRWLETEGKELSIVQRLQDLERVGAPGKFSMEQVIELFALACSPPEDYGRPTSHWTARELADEIIKQGIIESISIRHVGRLLEEAELQPHASRYWLTPPCGRRIWCQSGRYNWFIHQRNWASSSRGTDNIHWWNDRYSSYWTFRKGLRASFVSQEDLKNRILKFIDYFNQTMAKPFKWTYKGKVLAI